MQAGTDLETTQTPKIGRRQQGLAERRRRLVRAAGELIAERENGNFSMPELAARAGVSLATPYNLFGSKAAVLTQLFEGQVRGFNRDNAWMNGLPPAKRVLGVVDRLVAAYAREPRFYRNLVKALYALGTAETAQFASPVGTLLVQPLIEGLIGDGLVPAEVPKSVLATTLTRLFDATFERWALQDWPTDQLQVELRAGFALVFYGLFDDAAQATLAAAMKAATVQTD
ncbi:MULTISPECIES: TetR/AcrR family transcriptional regulator [unclassified Novosphingobium]|uniref:TetR/AcrR family transcriptional regulator n=1 Tax=unclassified Novosphingobium TaxID=2644732 RepID=UPI0025E17D35|nr:MULTISPECIES: TetR/AcrR family transcriptional regulator [unclassified Novosphingobium]